MINGVPLSSLVGAIACDTETTGLSTQRGDRPFMVLFMDEEEQYATVIWPVDPYTREVTPDPQDLAELRALFSQESRRFVFHHGKFDVQMLAAVGVDVRPDSWDDTLVAARVLRSGIPSAALKPLAKRFCGIPVDDEKALKKAVAAERRKGKKLGWKIGPVVETDYWVCPDLCEEYGRGDVLRTLSLWILFESQLNGSPLRNVYAREMELQPVVIKMEQRGIRCDLEDVIEGRLAAEEKAEDIRSRIREITRIPDFNPNSPNDIAAYFFHSQRHPVHKRTPTGQPKTDAKTLAAIDDPVARLILEYKKASKMGQFFASWEPMIVDGVIYGSFEPQAAHTGRFSARNPNFQQVPKRDPDLKKACRKPFRPREGYVWAALDYSQMELFMLGALAGDMEMLEGFRRGEDVHRNTAIRIWGEEAFNSSLRSRAKAVSFGISYGAGPAKVASESGLTFQEAVAVIAEYFDAFSSVREFMDASEKEARTTGAVINPFDRRVEVDRDTIYAATNYMIQSSGADIVKMAMIRIDRWLSEVCPEAGIILQIHDEIVIEMPKAFATIANLRIVRDLMVEGTEEKFGIPLQVEAEYVMPGRSWSTAAKVSL